MAGLIHAAPAPDNDVAVVGGAEAGDAVTLPGVVGTVPAETLPGVVPSVPATLPGVVPGVPATLPGVVPGVPVTLPEVVGNVPVTLPHPIPGPQAVVPGVEVAVKPNCRVEQETIETQTCTPRTEKLCEVSE